MRAIVFQRSFFPERQRLPNTEQHGVFGKIWSFFLHGVFGKIWSFFNARFFRNGEGCQYRTTRCFRKDLSVFQRSVFPQLQGSPVPNKLCSEISGRFSALSFSGTAKVANTEQQGVFGNMWSFIHARFFRNGKGCPYRTTRRFRKDLVVFQRSIFPQRQRLPVPNNNVFLAMIWSFFNARFFPQRQRLPIPNELLSERSDGFSALDFSGTAKVAITERVVFGKDLGSRERRSEDLTLTAVPTLKHPYGRCREHFQ